MGASNQEQNTVPLMPQNGTENKFVDHHDHQHSHKFQGKEAYISSQVNMFVEDTKPNIPDGGWGWLIVLSSLFINLVSDGVSFTFGLLYIPFLEEFGASRSATSWIGSLFLAVPLLAGPIGSALVDKYGCKYMTVLGGVICTVGFVLSSYAKSILVMYLTFGVIGGLGLGLCYITAVVSIAFWFEKHRTVALGLAASGSGIGTLIYSPLATYLLSEFGWRGTILILSGLFFNICVGGFLMRDPEWILEEQQTNKIKSAKSSKRNSICFGGSKSKKDEQYVLETCNTTIDISKKERFRSMVNLPTFIRRNEKVPLEVLKKLSQKDHLYSVILENYPKLLSARSNSDICLERLALEESLVTTRVPVKFSIKLKKTEEIHDSYDNFPAAVSPPHFLRKFPLHKRNQSHGYLKNIKNRQNSIAYRGAMLKTHTLKSASCPNIYRKCVVNIPDEYQEEEKWYEEYMSVLKNSTNFSLFLDLHFLLMSISTIILFIWFIVPYFYLADHMKDCGYTEQESSLAICVIGTTNTIGMVLFGWIGDRINVTKIYAACLVLCGITLGVMMLFSHSLIMLLLTSGFFGFWFASCFSLSPSILAQLVSLDKFTMAYGLLLLCQGIGNLIGPPLAGLLFDLTQSYEQSFYQAAFWIIVSGLLIGAIPYTTNRKLFGRKVEWSIVE